MPLPASRFLRCPAVALLGAGALSAAAVTAISFPAGAASHAVTGNDFHQTNLVSDLSNQGAVLVDPTLQNPWGLALSATSPLWVSDNNSGLAALYSIPAGGTSVTKVGLTVTVPGGRASTTHRSRSAER